jgi:hypothetical protein
VAALGSDQRDACSSSRFGSPELSLALAPVGPSLQGLHLRVLQRVGALTQVLAVVGEVERGLAMRKRTQGKLARLRGPCGAPLASVLLLVEAALPPQQPIERGQGAVKQWGTERMGHEVSEMGKRSGRGAGVGR